MLIEANARLTQKKRWPWMGAPGEVKWEEWMSTLRPLDQPKNPSEQTASDDKKGASRNAVSAGSDSIIAATDNGDKIASELEKLAILEPATSERDPAEKS